MPAKIDVMRLTCGLFCYLWIERQFRASSCLLGRAAGSREDSGRKWSNHQSPVSGERMNYCLRPGNSCCQEKEDAVDLLLHLLEGYG